MTRLRAVTAAAVLVLLAVIVIALGDSRAWSGGDAGGRAATAVAMHERGDWTPSVGYWAARWDPAGRHHPLVKTERRGEHWVQATSVPFAVAGRPFYAWLGPPGLLVVPILGCLAAAVGAYAIARWAGGRSGWPAFWAVGVLTPALFYAGDAWEHAPALGLALSALALALVGRRWPSALLAGIAAGVAVVLRAEVVLYVVAAGLAALVLPGLRRAWLRQWSRAAVIAGGAVVPVVANGFAEGRLLGAPLRSARAEALAQGAGASAGGRASDAALTTVGIVAESSAAAFVLGAFVVAALVVLGWWAVHGRPHRAVLAVGVIGIGLALAVAVRVDDGLGFVPGWLPAAPLAAAGLAAMFGRRGHGTGAGGGEAERQRFLGVTALLALPGVWATSHVGLLEAQWGGRYVLLTGALLTIVGVVAMAPATPGGATREGRHGSGRARAVAALVAIAVAVAGLGVAWRVQRTSEIAGLAAWVVDQGSAEAVVVSRWPELGREAGAWYGERRWLTVGTPGGTADALRVAAAAGATEVVLVVPEGIRPGPTPGWVQSGQAQRTVFGSTVTAVLLTTA